MYVHVHTPCGKTRKEKKRKKKKKTLFVIPLEIFFLTPGSWTTSTLNMKKVEGEKNKKK